MTCAALVRVCILGVARYLNSSGCVAIEGVDDGEELKIMVNAMNGLGFTDGEHALLPFF